MEKERGYLASERHTTMPCAPKNLYVIGVKRNPHQRTSHTTPNVYLRIDSGIIRRGTPDEVGWYATSPDGLSLSSGTPQKARYLAHRHYYATYTNEDIYPSHVEMGLRSL